MIKVQKNYIQNKVSKHNFSQDQKNILVKYILEPTVYVPNDDFPHCEQMKSVIDQKVKVISGKLLTADHEKILFQHMNYARYRISQIRKMLLHKNRWLQSELYELFNWHQLQQNVRSKLITANIGLVLALAKHRDLPGVDFADRVSEGSMALIRAIDKFDFGRGFKFSTYACHAIFKGISRAAKQIYRYHNKFPVQWDPVMEKDDYQERKREERLSDNVNEVRIIMSKNMADLSPVEQLVVKMRFYPNDLQRFPLTLKQVGDKLGLSKERIRQIQNKALSKLRIVAKDRMIKSASGS